MFIDIGTAFAKGVQGYYQGKDEAEKLRQIQEQLTMQKRMQDLQVQQAQQNLQAGILQLQQLAAQTRQVKNQLIKQDVYQALDAYNLSDGDNKFLNRLLQQNPDVRRLFGGVVRVENIDPRTDADWIRKQGIDPNMVAQNPFRFVKAIDENGNVNLVDMNAIYGATGYYNYKTQRDLEALKVKMKLRPSTEERLISRYRELDAKKKMGKLLTPQEEAEWRALNNKFTRNPTDMQRKVEAVEGGVNVGLHLEKAFENPQELTKIINDPEFIKNAKTYQVTTGKFMPAEDRRTYIAKLGFLDQAKDIIDEISNMKEEDIAKGPMDEGLQMLKEFLTSDRIKKMSPEERRKFINSIQVNTKLGMLIKSYVKATSGLAATDKEFETIKKIITAGTARNLPALKAALYQFYDTMKNETEKQLKLEARTYPGDIVDIVAPYSDILSFTPKESTILDEHTKKTLEGLGL